MALPASSTQHGTAYVLLSVVAILVSLFLWRRLFRRDDRLYLVYIAGLVGALLGAKIVYLFAEGFLQWGREGFWTQLATGKTVLGALPGGYAGVELGKRLIGYRGVTGDWFAVVVPVGIIIGRLGCLAHGCCPGRPLSPSWFTRTDGEGVARWPAVPAEIGFNLIALGLLFALRRARVLTGQHFHLYLMAYGLFRLGHEFVRDTPRLGSSGLISSYQVAALVVTILGAWGFRRRAVANRRTNGPAHAEGEWAQP